MNYKTSNKVATALFGLMIIAGVFFSSFIENPTESVTLQGAIALTCIFTFLGAQGFAESFALLDVDIHNEPNETWNSDEWKYTHLFNVIQSFLSTCALITFSTGDFVLGITLIILSTIGVWQFGMRYQTFKDKFILNKSEEDAE